ncbi:MAG: hypothetical protein WBE66_04135 [Mycobacterium sp.]
MSDLCVYALLLLLNLAVPFGVQVVVHVLGADAVRAERDELTGLLTRRAFRRRAKARLGQGRDQLAHVVITMIRSGPLQTAQRQLRTPHRRRCAGLGGTCAA